ncbi:hypothetical protein KY329_01890 [Candidatus Woesearchaeota archaeon]|nr:hypothetical protein [Candidatus Woesearchaeota archaeon]
MRKGQVTLFIIIGIIILLSVALVLYYQAETTKAPARKYVAVPEDIEPVYSYVTECLNQVSKDGLHILGTQGGFINIPGIIENTPSSYIPSDALGVVKTPLWYYEGEDRTPDLDFMAAELSRYIRARLPLCINNFAALEPEFTVSAAEMVPVVSFTSSDVVVELNWPMRISTVERTTSVDRFITDLPVRFKEMWLLADSIMRRENEKAWFENLTIDLYSADPEIPVAGMEVKCGASKWNLRLLKDRFSKVLSQNIPMVRVANTNYPPPDDSPSVYALLKQDAKNIRGDLAAGARPDWPVRTPEDTFEFNSMMLDTGFPQTDIKAGFYFMPGWDLKFIGKPNEGGVLSSNQMKGAPEFLRFLCMNSWHFTYDIIYPVKTILRDDTAFNGEGFLFQFGFPVIVKNNAPAREVFGVRKFKDAEIYPDFCTEFGDQVVDVRAMGFVENSPVAVELDNASVIYRCLNIECGLGKTYSDGSGHIRLYTYLPRGCSNPRLIVRKPGYIDADAFAVDGINDIQLTKLQKLGFVLKAHPYLSASKIWLPEKDLDEYLHATISISTDDYDQFFRYPEDEQELSLIYGDANYDIDILLMDDKTVIGGYHAENLSIPYSEFIGRDTMVFNLVEFRPYPVGSEAIAMFGYLYDGGMIEGEPYYEVLRPGFI